MPGSKAWLGLIRTKQEALEIPGPIAAMLQIWVVTSFIFIHSIKKLFSLLFFR